MKRSLKVYNKLGEKTIKKNICAHCGKQLYLWNYTVEHIIAKSGYGSNAVYNLCLLCQECNQDKADKIIQNPKVAYPYLKQQYITSINVMLVAYMDVLKHIDEKQKC